MSDSDWYSGSDIAFSDDELRESQSWDDTIFTAPEAKRPHENQTIQYTAYDDVLGIAARLVDTSDSRLVDVFGLTSDETLLVLQSQGWKEEAAIERYMEDETGVREKAGLPLVSSGPLYLTGTGTTARDCDICCETLPEAAFLWLSCGHAYCEGCYAQYLGGATEKGSPIECPEPGCALHLPFLLICRLAPAAYPVYLQNVTRLYITSCKTIKYCPAPDCERVVASSSVPVPAVGLVPVVKCLANHLFCFACGYENHVPAPCSVTQRWITKCNDDSETANWINCNTRNCPQCDSAIEKNGGCNHMVCKSCRHEFCWICMGDWKLHGTSYYQCNRFDKVKEEESLDQEKHRETARWSLKRYIHYYGLFKNHDVSLRQDERLFRKKIEPQILALRIAQSLSVADIHFFYEAHETLLEYRQALKWTFVVAYFLQRGNFQEIFESNQDFLTALIEELSLSFSEVSAEAMWRAKPKTLERISMVKRRRDIMVASTNAGLQDGSLEL